MRKLALVFLACLLLAVVASAQNTATAQAAPSANPFSDHTRRANERVKNILLRSAEKTPEENYSFKPADSVRTFGQMVGHVADAQYLFCSIVLGEANPAPKVEQTKTAKADLIAALKDGFAYCDRAYNNLTDASGAETIKLFGNDSPKLGALVVNNMHNMEHYGNLVTYMRMKNIVPPTSEPRPPQPETKQPATKQQ